MTRETPPPFVRIYYGKLQKEYPLVLYDPTALATYVRLLIVADQAWPAKPVLPTATRRADLELLRKGDLVTVGDHDIYTIKGYHKDRAKRQATARANADKRWSKRNATALPPQSNGTANTSTNTSTRPKKVNETVDKDGPRSLRLVDPSGTTA